MRKLYELHKKSVNQMLAFILSFITVCLFFKYLFVFFAPFILAFILAAIISRPVDLLINKAHMPRVVATIISMLVILSALVITVNLGVKLLLTQLLEFASGFPETLDKVTGMLNSFQNSYYDFFEIFPDDIRGFIDQSVMMAVSTATLWIGDSAKSFSMTAVKLIPKMFIFIIITLIATFFMTKDKKKINSFIRRQLPGSIGNAVYILKKDIFGALWGYIKAQLIMMCFTGCIAIIGLTVLGYKYSVLIGLTIAFFDALPVFGPGFVLWPWAAIHFLAGEYNFSIGLIVIYITITICRQLIEPKIISTQIGLYPLVTLMSLYIGLMVFGPVGLIGGPLLAICVRSLQNAGLLPNWK